MLTSSDRARRTDGECHRREVETDTLEAVDEILSEVAKQYIEPRIHADGGNGHILQRGRARSRLHDQPRLNVEFAFHRAAHAAALDDLRLPRSRLRTEQLVVTHRQVGARRAGVEREEKR